MFLSDRFQNEAINLKPRTVSICGQEFKIIETKKMLINGDNFHLKGKLYKGSLLFKIENKFCVLPIYISEPN
jgi:hypothetical protein